MALTKLAGISIFVTLSFQTLVILGESVLTSETDKDGEMKAPDKRINNFRVPMEMPYDPNFWPSRGRRGTFPDKAIQNDICYTLDRNFVFLKHGLRCQTLKIQEEEPDKGKWFMADTEFNPSGKVDDELLGRYTKMGSDCCEEVSRGKPSKKIPDLLGRNMLFSPKRFEELRYRKQRHFGLPQLILYGNGVYWEPENPYGEKKKKQDVFWVARGKKNFFYQK